MTGWPCLLYFHFDYSSGVKPFAPEFTTTDQSISRLTLSPVESTHTRHVLAQPRPPTTRPCKHRRLWQDDKFFTN